MVATPGKQYFGTNAVIKMTYGSDTIEVGIAQSAAFNYTSDDVKLYGCGDTMWQDVGRTNANVEVSLSYVKILPIAQDLAVRTLNSEGPSGGTITLDTQNTGYPKFEITCEVMSTDNNTTRTLTVSNVYFPNYTWELSFGEFITQTLEGSGNMLTISEGA